MLKENCRSKKTALELVSSLGEKFDSTLISHKVNYDLCPSSCINIVYNLNFSISFENNIFFYTMQSLPIA